MLRSSKLLSLSSSITIKRTGYCLPSSISCQPTTGTKNNNNNNRTIINHCHRSFFTTGAVGQQQQQSPVISAASNSQTPLKDVNLTRVIGESSGGKTFATYAVSFAVLHVALAVSITVYLLYFPNPEEEDKSVLRAVFAAREMQEELKKFTEEERNEYAETGQLPDNKKAPFDEKIDRLVSEKMSGKQSAKIVGSIGMLASACVSVILTTYFTRKFISKIALNSKVASAANRAQSMDIYIQSLNPFAKPQVHTVTEFKRLTVLQPRSKKPQVVFTPTFSDGSKPRIVYYFAQDKDDAQSVYNQLQNSGLLKK